ncbi:hypothetical protein HNP46_004768 [Pseudomonas nitritireducens]|uniref:DUF1266 domain-containing protein n=1 Tax=Pseudomonas nitroreducens TaxID=46680 RepID=A0A7W7P427_PSENT|nr:DUF1266 domain-containing protein [Pseudomonas nitritireducens]MBB4865867.1 hypothetical protein [Pseudomonas nitritireducens]
MMGWLLSGLTLFGLTGAGVWSARVWSRADSAASFARVRRRKPARSCGPEPLLCFGALMAAYEGRSGAALVRESGELASRLATELADCWSIGDARSARDVLQEMLLEAHSLPLDEDFRRLQRNEPSAFDGEQRLRWQRARQAWLRAGLALPKNLSMAAHDYECIAWLARRCHACGYLTEAEAWLCLAWVAEAAIRDFADWQAYAASYALVRATLQRDGQQGQQAIRAYKELMAAAGQWRATPLASIRVDDVVLQVEHEIAFPACQPRQSLLAFGSLIALSAGSRADRLAIAPDEGEMHRAWLARHWQAADPGQVKERLHWLLNTGSRARFDAQLERSVGRLSGDAGAMGHERYEQARRALLKAGHDPERVDGCRTTLAYDLERAAFGARLAFAAGLLDEDSLWNALRHMAREARSAFAEWEQYLCSVVIGHAMANQDRDAGRQLLRSGMALLDGISPFAEHLSPWRSCPLGRLPVLHSVASAAAH